MEKDFVRELDALSLAVRLKRISDQMTHSARALYKKEGIDIEPNWYLMFKLLKRKKRLSIMELAAALHFSHPTVVNMVKKMKAKGYLNTSQDEKDSRKQLVSLSDKSMAELPKMEHLWNAGEKAIIYMLDHDFLDKLTALEDQLEKKSYMERTENQLKKL